MKKIIWSLLIVLIPLSSTAGEVVVAKVNDAVIVIQELDAAVNRMIPGVSFHGKLAEETLKEVRSKALRDLINQELQYQDAVARSMKPDKKQVKARIQQIRDGYESSGKYKEAMRQAGLTEDQVRAKIEKNLLVEAAIGAIVTGPAQMTDPALQEYYQININKFKQPERAKLRVISAGNEAKAMAALSRIRGGEDFGDVAASMSEDDYRIMGGDIGFIHKGTLRPEVEDAAFTLKTGETSGPIKTVNGWNIIKVEEKQPERLMSFEESREKLKKDLEKKRADELMETWVSGLRAKARIEVLKTDSPTTNKK